MKSSNPILRTIFLRAATASCLFFVFPVHASDRIPRFWRCFDSSSENIRAKTAARPYFRIEDRQRHKHIDPWLIEYRREKRRQEEQSKKALEDARKKEKAEKTLEDNKRWEEMRTGLQNRFNAVDVQATLERAKADFTISTNLFAKSTPPEFVMHTNSMVKLTKQFWDAQKEAKSCFNPNAVLSHVEMKVSRYEKAHKALVREMDSFNRFLVSGNAEEYDKREVGGEFNRPVFHRRRTRPVFVSPNTREVPEADRSFPSSADKLRELKKLFDEGILTKEEYDTKRKELLDAL